MTDEEKDRPATFASPPCLMHEVDPAYFGLSDEAGTADVRRWRKAERKRLIDARLAITVADRQTYDAQIASCLESVVGEVRGATVSAYWPFRGEPNLLALVKAFSDRGAQAALPVVVQHGQPLVFRAWAPGETLTRGVWNIPIPEESAREIVPDIVIAPVIGFDRDCYRLGFGGGFYDRTLAAMSVRPRILGVGYSLAAIPTIYPQWHDVALDAVITEEGIACGPESPEKK